MGRLLDDLQPLSNAEAGALRLHREQLDPASSSPRAEAAFRAQAERPVSRSPSTPRRTSRSSTSTPSGSARSLANLVSNALRHTPAGGTITLAAARDGDEVAFSVTDTARGSQPDELDHVFDRFARSAESRGSGLGLAIAKRLVQAHGGAISAESEPARGRRSASCCREHRMRDDDAAEAGRGSPGPGSPIELAAYDPAWPDVFECEEARIAAALGGRALRIEHVGSTAVPGIAAKPIIDILLGSPTRPTRQPTHLD